MKLNSFGRSLWWAAAVLIVALGLGLGIGLGTRGDDKNGGDGADAASPSTTISTVEMTTTSSEEEDVLDVGEIPSLDYILAFDDVLWLMEGDYSRLIVLEKAIERALPDVPEAISDELETMAGQLAEATQTLEDLEIPSGQENDNYMVLQAAAHMADWIDATSAAVDAGRSSGSAEAAQVYLDEGDQARVVFETVMADYWMNAAPT